MLLIGIVSWLLGLSLAVAGICIFELRQLKRVEKGPIQWLTAARTSLGFAKYDAKRECFTIGQR